jgi:hypothetical protein
MTLVTIIASTTSFTSQMMLTKYAARILADEKMTGSGLLTNATPLLAGVLVEPRLDS